MSKKWDAIRGSAEFYVTMAVCLLVIGVSGIGPKGALALLFALWRRRHCGGGVGSP